MKPSILIVVEGGVVQDVILSGVEADVYTLDTDNCERGDDMVLQQEPTEEGGEVFSEILDAFANGDPTASPEGMSIEFEGGIVFMDGTGIDIHASTEGLMAGDPAVASVTWRGVKDLKRVGGGS